MRGCFNCRYCKYYPGDYWTPDDSECTAPIITDGTDNELADEVLDDIFTRVWENGEEWSDEEQLCPGWEEAPTPDDEYWEEYAYKENHYDKDEAE